MEDFAQPDFLRPSQWADLHRGAPDPIKRLMFAVLEQGLREALGVKRSSGSRRRTRRASVLAAAARVAVRRRSRRRQDAVDWIFDRDATGVFSFENICSELGIDAERLRARVREDGGASG